MKPYDSRYDQFKTGFSYLDILQMLRIEQNEGKRRHITRHTVLGKWHEIKLRMWAEFIEFYENKT